MRFEHRIAYIYISFRKNQIELKIRQTFHSTQTSGRVPQIFAKVHSERARNAHILVYSIEPTKLDVAPKSRGSNESAYDRRCATRAARVSHFEERNPNVVRGTRVRGRADLVAHFKPTMPQLAFFHNTFLRTRPYIRPREFDVRSAGIKRMFTYGQTSTRLDAVIGPSGRG